MTDNSHLSIVGELVTEPQGSVPRQRSVVRYPASVPSRLPAVPRYQVRPAGFLGLGQNRQDVEHDTRMTELHHLGVETAYAEATAFGVEGAAIQGAAAAMSAAEDVVNQLPEDSVATLLAADMASDFAARVRLRHGRLMENNDAEALNLIHRR